MEYYNYLKIQRACSFLHFSDMKIKEIAFKLGYSDPFHFTRAFRKEMDITPKEYRKWGAENDRRDVARHVSTKFCSDDTSISQKCRLVNLY